MKLPRRQFLHLAAGAAALPAVARVAKAQAYPLRPVRILCGFTGGVDDLLARLLGAETVIESGLNDGDDGNLLLIDRSRATVPSAKREFDVNI